VRPVIVLMMRWLISWPLKINERRLNRNTWQPSERLDSSDWTMGLRPIDLTGVFGRYAEYLFVTLTTLFGWGLYKYVVAGSKGTLLALWHIWHPCEPKQAPPTHLHPWFIIKVRLWVISSAFAWVIASSGTWWSFGLRNSCYSWWLPPPRWLEGSGGVVARVGDCSWPPSHDCEGFLCLPRRSAKGNSNILHVSLSYLTYGSVLTVSTGWTRFVLHLLAAEPPSVGRHNGTSVPASTWTSGEKSCVHLVYDWISPGDWSSYIVIGSSSTRWYKDHIPLIYISAN
jgi:hypothetical protein